MSAVDDLELIQISAEPGDDAATWTPDLDQADTPVVQYGRRPRIGYLPWGRSQTVDIAAECDGDTFTHYWGCPKRGCTAWAGMRHVFYGHDVPATHRRAERRATR